MCENAMTDYPHINRSNGRPLGLIVDLKVQVIHFFVSTAKDYSIIHDAARIFVHSLIVLGAGHVQQKMRPLIQQKNTIVLCDLN